MSLNIKTLSNTLKSISQTTDFSKVSIATEEAINSFDATIKTAFGSEIGEIKGGVEIITHEIDDAIQSSDVNLVPTISRITENISGVGYRLVGDIGVAASDIELITGKSINSLDKLSHEIITAASPAAISKSLTSVTGLMPDNIKSTINNLSLPKFSTIITSSIQAGAPYKSFQNRAKTFISNFNNSIKSMSGIPLLDLGEKLERNYENQILALTDRPANLEDIKNTFALVTDGDYKTSFEIIKKYINVPDNYEYIIRNFPKSVWSEEISIANAHVLEAAEKFNTINPAISSYINPHSPESEAAGTNSSEIRPVSPSSGSDGNSWEFSNIESFDELEGMFRNINRQSGKEITGAIIHWSATFLDQNIDADWINRSHLNRNFSGIGYHIIIKRDGTLQRGRPLNRSGAHDINNNTNFLGFCFVGGVNEFSSNAEKPYWRYSSVESLTPAQFSTYNKLMETFHKVFPYAQVQGHYATSNEGKTDPGFDVPGYSLSKFGHLNVISENDPRWKSSTPISLTAIKEAGAII